MRYLILLLAAVPVLSGAQPISSTTTCNETWNGGVQCQTRQAPRIESAPSVHVPQISSGIDYEQIRGIGSAYSQGQSSAINDALLIQQLQIAALERERLELELMRNQEYRQLLAEQQRRQDRAYANEVVSNCFEKRKPERKIDCLAEALEDDPRFPAGFWELVGELQPEQMTQLVGDLAERTSLSFPGF